jgi:ABC-type transporter Mla subunit MlaD
MRSSTLGALMIAATALLLAGIFWLRREQGVVYYAELREASGLRVGAPVHFRGITVGLVRDVVFTDTSVRLTLLITREDMPLPAGTRFRPRALGIFGDHAVELTPSATPSAARLAEGAVLPQALPDSALARERLVAEAMAAELLRSLKGRARADSVPAFAGPSR